jgi:hypothetical protein
MLSNFIRKSHNALPIFTLYAISPLSAIKGNRALLIKKKKYQERAGHG